MIAIKCNVDNAMKLTDMEPFQGDLKKRTTKDVRNMQRSLLKEGLLMPFVIWQHDGKNYLLDGHGRRQALLDLAELDTDISKQTFPYLLIQAETEDEAKTALLEITSSYGKITKQGAIKFTSTMSVMPVTPSVIKFVEHKTSTPVSAPVVTDTIIRVRVPMDKADEVTKIFNSIAYITVL